MALKVNSDIALTGSLTVSGSYGLAAADIPSLAASKITSGTFAAARIPSLAASKITTGTFADARIASAANWNTAYGWGNHASAGYSTFDGAYDSLTGRPTIPTNNNQLTNGAGYITSYTNYYLNGISKSGNTLTFSVSGATNQTYTFGSLAFSSATYDNYGSWNLKTGGTQRTTIGSGDALDIVGGSNVSVAYSAGGVVTISSTDTNTFRAIHDTPVNGATTTSISSNWAFDNVKTAVPSGAVFTDTNTVTRVGVSGSEASGVITLAASGSASISQSGTTVTISATDTNTQLSDAQVRSKISGTGLISYNSSTGVISTTANNYSLPAGSSSTRGGFKIGYAENGKNYPVEVSSEKMYVNVPWTDTNTDTDTITRVGVSGSEISGDITIAASGAASVSQTGGTITISATNTTYGEYSGSSAGLVPSGSGGAGKFLQEDGQWAIPTDSNTTYSAGAGLTLSGTTFAVDSNLAGDVFTIGRDGNDKYTVNTTNHAWYLDGVLDMRLNNDGNLDVDGDVIAYSTVTSSDRKLKTDIETLENACEKVCNLRGVSFTWDHGRKTGKKDIGLIAQEVEEVVPEIVGEAELLDGTMAKHVDYPKLVALLIEANKELCDRISNLEAKINGITE